VTEDMLCVSVLPTQTTEIFKATDNLIEKKELERRNCIGFCTDGAACITGRHSEVAAKIKEVAGANMVLTHCFIHKEHLAAKKVAPELNESLSHLLKLLIILKIAL
jgi:hypothetical protein